MKKINRSLIISLAAFILIIIACGVYTYSRYNSELSSGTIYHNQNLSPGDAYLNHQYGFKIIPPANWVIADENVQDGVPVEFVNRMKEVQGLIRVTSISKSGITNSNFDTYVSNAVQKVKEDSRAVIISSQKLEPTSTHSYLLEYKLKINGGSGYKGSGLTHVLQLTLLTKDGQAFIVTGTTDDVEWSNFKDVIISSFMSFTSY